MTWVLFGMRSIGAIIISNTRAFAMQVVHKAIFWFNTPRRQALGLAGNISHASCSCCDQWRTLLVDNFLGFVQPAHNIMLLRRY
jgi:hypothetical protein